MPDDRQPGSVLRIATRGSRLALAQSALAGEMLGVPCELVTFSTRGDRTAGPLTEGGGKGLFTAELEAALRAGQVHLAVHSAKDMPAEMDGDLVIGCVPSREDARDVLVSHKGSLKELPPQPRIGTSSFRRSVQLRLLGPDVQTLPLRGNVETRLRKLREGQYDAIVLAMAGLNRLSLAQELAGALYPLEIEDFVPAAGQAALALQCRAADNATRAILTRLNDADSAAALAAERSVVARLHASCHSALGVHVRRRPLFASATDRGGTFSLRSLSHPTTEIEGATPKRLLFGGVPERMPTPPNEQRLEVAPALETPIPKAPAAKARAARTPAAEAVDSYLWRGDAIASDVDGRHVIRVHAGGASAALVADDIFEQLSRQGAGQLLQEPAT